MKFFLAGLRKHSFSKCNPSQVILKVWWESIFLSHYWMALSLVIFYLFKSLANILKENGNSSTKYCSVSQILSLRKFFDDGAGVIFFFSVTVFLTHSYKTHLYIWDKVFTSVPSKICGRQPLKNLKGYGLLQQTISLQIF